MLVELGAAHQVFNNPQEDRTRMFLEQILSPQPRKEPLRRASPAPEPHLCFAGR